MAVNVDEAIEWVDGPAGNTPLSAENLNKINKTTAQELKNSEENLAAINKDLTQKITNLQAGIEGGSVVSKNATNATNVVITNKDEEDNALVNFGIGTGSYIKTINNVDNANKVGNVNFSEDSVAKFGNYIIEKSKEVMTSILKSDSSTGAVEAFLDVAEIKKGDIFDFSLSLATVSVEDEGARVYRCQVVSNPADGCDWRLSQDITNAYILDNQLHAIHWTTSVRISFRLEANKWKVILHSPSNFPTFVEYNSSLSFQEVGKQSVHPQCLSTESGLEPYQGEAILYKIWKIIK